MALATAPLDTRGESRKNTPRNPLLQSQSSHSCERDESNLNKPQNPSVSFSVLFRLTLFKPNLEFPPPPAMITQAHRKAINEALYRRRLRQPYLLRCLPLGHEDTWLPLPPNCRSEVQICVEAAHLRKSVEMADYTTFHPILVSIETDSQGRVMLYKERPNKPSLLWLQWLAATHKINVLVNIGTMEYLLSTGPKIYVADLDLDTPPRPTTRKDTQSKNWLAWFETAYPDLYPNLIGSRA